MDGFRHMMLTNYPAFINFNSATFGAAGTPDKGSTSDPDVPAGRQRFAR